MDKPIINVADEPVGRGGSHRPGRGSRGGEADVTLHLHGVGPQRHGLWLIYLPKYLDANGTVSADPGIDRTFVEFTTAIVDRATRAAAGKRANRVTCRPCGRPLTCHGEIEAVIVQWPRRIEWWCPVCADSGSIFGWEWTRWNRLQPAARRKSATRKTWVAKKQRKAA